MDRGKSNLPGNSLFLFPVICHTQNELRVTSRDKFLHVKLIITNITFQNGDSEICSSIDPSQRQGCLHRSNRCISSHLNSSAVKEYLRFTFDNQVFQFRALHFVISLGKFTKLMDVIAAHLRQRSISPFSYLNDWLIKDLLRRRLTSQTIFCLQTMQVLKFIQNIEKSDLIRSQKFTFIGMEFLLITIMSEYYQAILLPIKQFLTQIQVLA